MTVATPDYDEPAELVDRTANNQLDAPERLDEPLDDIDAVNPDETDDDPELSADAELAVWGSPLRAPLERFADRPLPTLASTWASSRWWTRYLLRALAQLILHAPQLTLMQLPHIGRGVAKGAGAYARYRGKERWLTSAEQAEGNQRALRVENVERAKRGATRMTVLSVLLLACSTAVALSFGYWLPVVAAFLVGMVVADLAGRRDAPVTGGPEILPRAPFQEGAPSRMVVADIRAVLERRGHDADRLAVVEPRVAKYGMEMVVHSENGLTEDDLTSIERGLQTFAGAVSSMADRDNAALTTLRIMWEDPLASTYAPLLYAPNSQSVANPAVLGYGLGGVPLELNLMRVNCGIVGGPGSGKSSAMWAISDYLTACWNVVVHGIDLSGGPMLNAWGDAIQGDVAFDAESAEKLLTKRIASAIARTKLLAARSRPVPGAQAPKSENWEVSDGMFHVILIDEVPLVAKNERLRDLLAEYLRIGRKAGETVIWAAQDMTKETLGATSLRKYPSTIVLMACSREDVTQALGGNKINEGWAPHRFTPAEGDDPNDAGKCFLKSGRHNRPVPWRFARLEQADIWPRAIERIEAGRPVDDEQIADYQDAAVVPIELTRLLTVFMQEGDPEFLPSERICAVLNEDVDPDDEDALWTPRKVADSLRGDGWEVRPRRPRVGGVPTRGYALADVRKVVEQL